MGALTVPNLFFSSSILEAYHLPKILALNPSTLTTPTLSTMILMLRHIND